MVVPFEPQDGTFVELWRESHDPNRSDSYWSNAGAVQIGLAFGRLGPFLANQPNFTRELVRVVGTHEVSGMSDRPHAMLTMPIYLFPNPELGIQVVAKSDFHKWVVSVSSDAPLDIDFGDLFDTTAKVDTTLLDGFKPEWIFEPYAANQQQFTLQMDVSENERMYILFWLLKNSHGA